MERILHLLGLPHTVTRESYSHCAYTGKVKRFSPMMRKEGFSVVHYGVGGMESGATEDVVVMPEDEMSHLRGGSYDPTGWGFVGDVANVDSALYHEFNLRLGRLLKDRVQPEDFVCLPFGHAHAEALDSEIPGVRIETGIGYPTCVERFRVYESQAWAHWHYGKMNLSRGDDYWWVVPNYFSSHEWPFIEEPTKDYVAYFGRLTEIKGLQIVMEIARHRPDLRFVLCGQGDPTQWLSYGLNNVEYSKPITGFARARFLGEALCVLLPTRYLEPFGGVAVESMFCGTPVLTSAFGAFTETVVHRVTGFHCRTLGDWLAGIERVEDNTLFRRQIRRHALFCYSTDVVGRLYHQIFDQIDDLRTPRGWFTFRSSIGPIARAIEVSGVPS